jgi:hypothetical protein
VSVEGCQRDITAVGWIPKSKMLKMFIGTTSTTLPGPPLVVQRTKIDVIDNIRQRVHINKSTERPKLVHDLFEHFSTIDHHDHLRQGNLQMEIFWKTKVWWRRLFTTLLAMVLTDCYLAYSYEFKLFYQSEDNLMSMHTFMGKMAHLLIFNKEDQNERSKRARNHDEPTYEVSLNNI